MGKFSESARDEADIREHVSQDKIARFLVDQILRDFGLRIHARPKYGPPVWEWSGRLYTQDEAVALVDEVEGEYES